MIISSGNPYARNCCIDYGCEAVWAGYYDGLDAVPGALIKYTCIETCYHQLCKNAGFFSIDYPAFIKKNALLYVAARVLAPLFIKRCIGVLIDGILSRFFGCDQEDNQMLETA